ncbi:hypothetical protein [Rhodococcus sp. NPDC049939]|uniref:hypothetical protein n=1 Tax=Rhodococcus sp. NPDC049939 TaxID=3155511 RepID=UPI0033CEE447
MDFEAAKKLVSQSVPEPIRKHWVDVDGVRYPPKQAYQLISRLPKESFKTHTALARLRGIGFITSAYQPETGANQTEPNAAGGATQADYTNLLAAFSTVLGFLHAKDLTERLSSAESVFVGSGMTGCADTVERFEFSEDLLDAALAVRQHVGRLNDVIHATVIARCLPLILEPGETVKARPSLGAGNDPSRPFDLETDRRIAEFKTAQWKGADTMRERGVFVDLVHLALDDTGRRAQLFVVGPDPKKFLVTSTRSAEKVLDRSSPRTRTRFEEKFGPAGQITVAEFTGGPAAHIEIIDIATLVPSLS